MLRSGGAAGSRMAAAGVRSCVYTHNTAAAGPLVLPGLRLYHNDGGLFCAESVAAPQPVLTPTRFLLYVCFLCVLAHATVFFFGRSFSLTRLYVSAGVPCGCLTAFLRACVVCVCCAPWLRACKDRLIACRRPWHMYVFCMRATHVSERAVFDAAPRLRHDCVDAAQTAHAAE